ncbi:MAG: hypothetical protein ABWJ42_06270 [Sulfolobales archaeon]
MIDSSALTRISSRDLVKILMNNEWDLALSKFFLKLQDTLKSNLVGIVFPASEIYESNVLVIVRRRDLDVISEIVRIAFEIEREFGDRVSINPYIALESEDLVIKTFKETIRDNIDQKAQEEALRVFRERVLKLDYVVDVVIPSSEIYESNVLVIVRRRDLDVISEIVRIAFEIEREFGDRVSINPYIALESEDLVIKTFKETARGGN